MSSLSRKQKARDLSSDWSEWTWDANRSAYYKARTDAYGDWEYFWDKKVPLSPETPRTSDAAPFTFSDSSNGPENPNYTTIHTGAGSSSRYGANPSTIDGLTGKLAEASLAAPDSALNPRYEVITSPSRFFKIGRVFKTLWTEPAGNVSEFDGEFVIPATFGEKAYAKIRYFVVIREMQGCSLCLPLNTHNFSGAGKQRIRVEDYAAVYPSGSDPNFGKNENLTKQPFPIIIEDCEERLNPTSRLNFGRVYTVEHNIKVLKVGRIPDEYLPLLDKYFVERIAGKSTNQPSTLVEPKAYATRSIEDSNNNYPGSFLSYVPVSPYSAALSDAPSTSASANYEELQRPGTASSTRSGSMTPTSNVHKHISGTRGDKEKLDPKFRVHHSKYFKPGEVFKILWSEPKSATLKNANSGYDTDVTDSEYPEKAYSRVRRFVIVAADNGHCQCVPILTYQRQGTTKWGVKRDEHAVIYIGDTPPPLIEGEAGLIKAPIRVIPKSPRDKLEPACRVNYAKIYTVEHNVKVQFIGHIASTHHWQFNEDFDATWAAKRMMGSSYS